MKVRILINDSVCIITGLSAFNFEFKILSAKQERTFDPVSHGMKGSVFRECWEEMEAIGKSIGSKLTYSK